MATRHKAKAITAEGGSLQPCRLFLLKECSSEHFDLAVHSFKLRTSTSAPGDYWELHNVESAGPVPALSEDGPTPRSGASFPNRVYFSASAA